MIFSICLCVLSLAQSPSMDEAEPLSLEEKIKIAGQLLGLEFTAEEARLMKRGVGRSNRAYRRIRGVTLANGVAPALGFSVTPPGVEIRPAGIAKNEIRLPQLERPENLEDMAFMSIREMAALIRSKKVSCVELAKMQLARLRRLDGKLHAVITYTEERALAQAARLDRELAEGRWRGLLHGIPYGAKDLLAVDGYPTTWGAKPFEDQVIPLDATVVRKLDEAGAVLIAKLSLGALAMGDVWYGGMTRNPWNPEQGSSGSSAGPAAATAAGGVAFSIGSETLGSIVSPSTRCGCSSLRPTFGRVSRHGAMALSWSMDKLGPICRSADDAAIVFAAIHGPDGKDPAVRQLPFTIPEGVSIEGWKIGFLEREAASMEPYRAVIDKLRELGAELVPFTPPEYPGRALRIILNAEAAAAFDELTRSGKDELLVRQIQGAWPNSFRVSRLIPAVEYIQANRIRTVLMHDMHEAMDGIEAFVHPSFATLLLSNLTGHPTVVVPNGFGRRGAPRSISFTGQLFGESRLLAIARAWQEATGHHERHPELSGR